MENEVKARTTNKPRIDTLRIYARKYGYKLRSSRIRKYTTRANQGGFQIANGAGQVVLGPTFDLTLDDVERFLLAKAAECTVENATC